MAMQYGFLQWYHRTTGLPSGAFTACWWSMLTNDLNTYTPQWMLWESGATNPRYIQCGSGLDGTSFVGEVHNSTSNGGGWVDTGTLANVSTNSWYFWALTLSAYTGSFTLNGYVRAASATALTSGTVNSTWSGTFAPNNMRLASEGPYGGRFEGRLAHFKLFSGVLSSAQILAESLQGHPVSKDASLNYWALLNDGQGIYDQGPGGSTWTLQGTPTSAEGPPVPMKRRRVYTTYIAGVSPPPPPSPIPVFMHHYKQQGAA